MKAVQENAEERTDSTKLKKSLKHDFSFANWGEATERWLKGVRKRYTILFPDISKQARILAGIKVKQTDTDSSSSVLTSDSSGRDLDSDYEGLRTGSNDRDEHQNNLNGDGNTEQTGVDAGNHQGSGDDGDGDQQEGDDDHVGQESDEADVQQEADNEDDGVEGSGNNLDLGDDDYEMLEVRSEHAGDSEASELEKEPSASESASESAELDMYM